MCVCVFVWRALTDSVWVCDRGCQRGVREMCLVSHSADLISGQTVHSGPAVAPYITPAVIHTPAWRDPPGCAHTHTHTETHTCSYLVMCTRCIGIHAHSHFLNRMSDQVHSAKLKSSSQSLFHVFFSSFLFSDLCHDIKQKLHKLTIYLDIFKQSVELRAVCGNIVWGQRVSWFPQGAARHLHNLCNSYQEFDTALNSDICTMLIDVSCISMRTSPCWCAEWERAFKSVHIHIGVCVCWSEWVTLCAVLWPVVIWRSVLMWSQPAGVDLPSPAL